MGVDEAGRHHVRFAVEGLAPDEPGTHDRDPVAHDAHIREPARLAGPVHERAVLEDEVERRFAQSMSFAMSP